MRALIVGLLCACSLVEGKSELATVYRCGQIEVCWASELAELERDLGSTCKPSSRLVVPVCLYECPPPAHGCNARQGCYCPEGS